MTDERRDIQRRQGDRQLRRDVKALAREVRRYRRWVQAAFLSILLVFGTLFFLQELEQKERRDQACRLFEGEHLADVKQLRATYKFVVRLSSAELRAPLGRTILTSLPQTEAKAVDRAPLYCDETYRKIPFVGHSYDYGNAEPDPVVPKRPVAVDRLLHR